MILFGIAIKCPHKNQKLLKEPKNTLIRMAANLYKKDNSIILPNNNHRIHYLCRATLFFSIKNEVMSDNVKK